MQLNRSLLHTIIFLSASMGMIQAGDANKTQKDDVRSLLEQLNKPTQAQAQINKSAQNSNAKNNTEQKKNSKEREETTNIWGVNNLEDGLDLVREAAILTKNLAAAFTWTRQWFYLTEQEKNALEEEHEKLKSAKEIRKVREAEIALNRCIIRHYKEEKNNDGLPCACDKELNELKRLAVDSNELADLIAKLSKVCERQE